MKKQSAGILLYRIKNNMLEVFLVHPGGPFWKNKDIGAWTIPKGEFNDTETALDAALREFREETSHAPLGPFTPLTTIRQKGGKEVHAWSAIGDLETSSLSSNTFEMEWPPKSGRLQSFPEVNKYGWFDMELASQLINPAQLAFLKELSASLS